MSRGPEVHGPWIPNQEALATSASRSWDLSGHFGAIITTLTPLEMTDFSSKCKVHTRARTPFTRLLTVSGNSAIAEKRETAVKHNNSREPIISLLMNFDY